MSTSSAFYFDGRYLTKEEVELVQCAVSDMDSFVKRDNSIHRAMIFPAVDSRRRYLIHKTIQQYYPQLCSFSVGEGVQRRLIVAYIERLEINVTTTDNKKKTPTKSNVKAPPTKKARLDPSAAMKSTVRTEEQSVQTQLSVGECSKKSVSLDSPHMACEAMAEKMALDLIDGECSNDARPIVHVSNGIPASTDTADSIIDCLPRSIAEFDACESTASQRRHSTRLNNEAAALMTASSSTDAVGKDTSPPIDDDDLEVAMINSTFEQEQHNVSVLCASSTKQAFYSNDASPKLADEASTSAMIVTDSGEWQEWEREAAEKSMQSTTNQSDDEDDTHEWALRMLAEHRDLQPKVLEDITSALGSVHLERPQYDYTTNFVTPSLLLRETAQTTQGLYTYTEVDNHDPPPRPPPRPKPLLNVDTTLPLDDVLSPLAMTKRADDKQRLELAESELDHVCEMHGFPASARPDDLTQALRQVVGGQTKYAMKWVDDTHALISFMTSEMAAMAMTSAHPLIRFRCVRDASDASRNVLLTCDDLHRPYRPRPVANVTLVRRLVESHLGKRSTISPNERAHERALINHARELKRNDQFWDGRV